MFELIQSSVNIGIWQVISVLKFQLKSIADLLLWLSVMVLVVMFAFEWNLHLNIITHKGIAAILQVVGLSLDLAVSYCCTNVLCCPYSL